VSSTSVPPDAERIRAFVALDLDAESTRRIARLSDRLRGSTGAPAATWISPQQVHLTLKFLGDAATPRVAHLSEAVAAVARGTPRLRAAAIRVNGLPTLQHARVVVAAVDDPDGHLEGLAGRIEDLCADLGFARESRAFRPHITLARLKRPCDTRSWLRPDLAAASGDVLPTCLVIYRSVLDAAGARYFPLARFELTG